MFFFFASLLLLLLQLLLLLAIFVAFAVQIARRGNCLSADDLQLSFRRSGTCAVFAIALSLLQTGKQLRQASVCIW